MCVAVLGNKGHTYQKTNPRDISASADHSLVGEQELRQVAGECNPFEDFAPQTNHFLLNTPHLLLLLIIILFFETESLCVALAVLELALQTKLALNSEPHLPLPSKS